MLKKTWGHFKVLTSLPPHSITALPATHRNFPILLVMLNSSLLAMSKFGLSPLFKVSLCTCAFGLIPSHLLDLIFLVSFHFYLCLQLLHFSSVYIVSSPLILILHVSPSFSSISVIFELCKSIHSDLHFLISVNFFACSDLAFISYFYWNCYC